MPSQRSHSREFRFGGGKAAGLVILLMATGSVAACSGTECVGTGAEHGECRGYVDAEIDFGDGIGRTVGKNGWYHYVCSPLPYPHGEEIQCFDPDSDPARWLSPEWLIRYSVEVPDEVFFCDDVVISMSVTADALTIGTAKIGQKYEPDNGALGWSAGMASGSLNVWAKYRIESGSLEFVESSVDKYEFMLTDVVLVRDPGADSTDGEQLAQHCGFPERYSLTSVSGKCDVQVRDDGCW